MQLFLIVSALSLLSGVSATLSVPNEDQQRALRVQSTTETLGSIITEEEDLAVLASLINSTDLLGLAFDETIDPLTVFAPGNDAFLAFTDSAVELADRVLNRDDFALHRLSLLLNHITSGAFFVCNFMDGQVVEALNGESLTVGVDLLDALTVTSPGSTVEVVDADFEAINGVVHKVDGVLVPFWWGADLDVIIESLASSGYSTIDGLFLDIGGIGEFLCEGTVGTVFLPNDAALAGLVAGDLFEALSNHIVLGVHTSQSLSPGDTLQTLAGTVLEVTMGSDGSLMVGGATVVLADVLANDGVVHGISSALALSTSENSVTRPSDITDPAPPATADPVPTDNTDSVTPVTPDPLSTGNTDSVPPAPAPSSVDTPNSAGPPTRKQMKKVSKQMDMKVVKKKDKLKEVKLSKEKKVKIKKESGGKGDDSGKGAKGSSRKMGRDGGMGGKRGNGNGMQGKGMKKSVEPEAKTESADY